MFHVVSRESKIISLVSLNKIDLLLDGFPQLSSIHAFMKFFTMMKKVGALEKYLILKTSLKKIDFCKALLIGNKPM